MVLGLPDLPTLSCGTLPSSVGFVTSTGSAQSRACELGVGDLQLSSQRATAAALLWPHVLLMLQLRVYWLTSQVLLLLLLLPLLLWPLLRMLTSWLP